MKVGDIVKLKVLDDVLLSIIVDELAFDTYCTYHDDRMLEYDPDDAWDAWQKEGPVFQALLPDGTLEYFWPRHVIVDLNE